MIDEWEYCDILSSNYASVIIFVIIYMLQWKSYCSYVKLINALEKLTLITTNSYIYYFDSSR